MPLTLSNDIIKWRQGGLEKSKAAIRVGNKNANVIKHSSIVLPNGQDEPPPARGASKTFDFCVVRRRSQPRPGRNLCRIDVHQPRRGDIIALCRSYGACEFLFVIHLQRCRACGTGPWTQTQRENFTPGPSKRMNIAATATAAAIVSQFRFTSKISPFRGANSGS